MSAFQPSEYSGGYIALNNAGAVYADKNCSSYKDEADRYREKMWKSTIFTAERQAYEHKANAADANYLACKEAKNTKSGSIANLSHKQGTGMSRSSGSASTVSTTPAQDVAAADIAAAAAAESSSMVPMLLAFGGIVLVGGIAFMVYRKKKASGNKLKLKKKKHGKVVAQAAAPIEKHAPEHA